MLSKRDAENARLREQREQQSAELNERRQKDSVKQASFQEYKALVESNSVSLRKAISYTLYLQPFQERITILQSELSRCKAQLAATANCEELMLFFLGGNADEVKYFKMATERQT